MILIRRVLDGICALLVPSFPSASESEPPTNSVQGFSTMIKGNDPSEAGKPYENRTLLHIYFSF